MVQYVRGNFFAGEDFTDLADAQARAQAWCAHKAGQRIHGTTCQQPAVVLATTLGHIAVRRRIPTLMLRADAMSKRLKASRLDNSTEAQMRRLAQIRLLIIDDFALQPMDATATADFYELVVARHLRVSTVLTLNRSLDEWLAVMTDPLLAQSAVDRLTSTTHELVIEGQSYRRRQKPSVDTRPTTADHPQ